MNRFNRLVCAVVLVSFILNTALSDIAIADLLPAKPIASSRTATLGVPSGLDDITGVVRQDRQRIDALTRLGLIQAADKNTGRIDMAHFADIVRALKDPNFKTQVVVSPDTIEILPEGHLSVLCKEIGRAHV